MFFYASGTDLVALLAMFFLGDAAQNNHKAQIMVKFGTTVLQKIGLRYASTEGVGFLTTHFQHNPYA